MINKNVDTIISESNKQLSANRAQWYTLTVQQIATQLDADTRNGLTTTEAQRRLAQSGPNRLPPRKRRSIVAEFIKELREPLILMLLVTGILYGLWGELSDTLTIFAVILVVLGVEIFNERRAEQAIGALGNLSEPTALIRRDGQYVALPAAQIVLGDMMMVQAGQRVSADARLVTAIGLMADESSLSGESIAVEKDATFTLPTGTPLAERHNMVFAGSTISQGQGTAMVIATGSATELGHIAALARRVKPPRTTLQISMRALSRWLVWIALGFSLVIPLLGWIRGQPLQQMILTGLSLAFATIPEELPIIITMVLALGAYRLSKRKAIVKRLQAVETIGGVTVIATDKTGTLTENRMAVNHFMPESASTQLLEMGILCSHAVRSGSDFFGDPLETALLRAAQQGGLNLENIRQAHPLATEFTFDNIRKRMSIVYGEGSDLHVIVKGAPERVLPLTNSDQQVISGQVETMAADGLRVLAFAEKTVRAETFTQATAEVGLTLVGLVGLSDPPRTDVKEALAASRAAGIRSIMITGDHPLTAQVIARQVGLDNTQTITGSQLDEMSNAALDAVVGQPIIYARTTPEHKLRIVTALQRLGERVAVTGDGVNDAPALAAADIGIAMGETGTDVAREAAGMILADDNYTTIVRAIHEGRILFENLKKGVRYYLACKVALISITLLAVVLGVPVPFAPIQIVLMELFMDLAASATFVAEPPESDLMRQKSRDTQTAFLNRSMGISILVSSIGLFAAVSVSYLVTWWSGANLIQAQTVAFVTWLIGHVLLAFNLRSEREPLLRLGLLSNRLMLVWAAVTAVFVLAVTLAPGIEVLLKTGALSSNQWALVLGTAVDNIRN